MMIYRCDTRAYDERLRMDKLSVQCPELEPHMAMLSDSGLFRHPFREGEAAGSLFDFVYSVGFELETLTILNDIAWPRTSSPLLVGMFGALEKLGFHFFPPTLFKDEETLVTQGLPAPDSSRLMVPIENQIFAYVAFALVWEEWKKK